MDLSNLKPAPGATRARKRVGRGPGSGLGKTSGRGHKGRGARTGGKTPPGYEGGQMPLQRRLPKRGFNHPFRVEYAVVNLWQLERAFDSGAIVDLEALRSMRLIRRNARLVKVLAKGAIHKPLTVKAHKFSAPARAQLEAVGGTAEVIAGA